MGYNEDEIYYFSHKKEKWKGEEDNQISWIEEININVDNDLCLSKKGKFECFMRGGYCLAGHEQFDTCPFFQA